MSRQSPFIPGRLATPRCPLAHYRPLQPAGAVADYARSLTAPGDLVVDLFCQGPQFVGEVILNDRCAVGLSINPLLLLSARLGLSDDVSQAVASAFTQLANGYKGDRPLHSHLNSLYRSFCPVCGAAGVADWFAWDRSLGRAFEKAVRCPECAQTQIGSTDEEDERLVRSVTPRGLAYYYALDRAAPLGHPARDRASELVDCYTPRNLSALMDITRRLEGLNVLDDTLVALRAVLLDCYDRGSSLYPYDEDRRRPRTLRIPVRYYERNVWTLFENGLADLGAAGYQSSVFEAESVLSVMRGEAAGYVLISRAARDIQEVVPEATVALAVVDPPRPDGVFWALSALWATWLWDSSEAHVMRPFLQRRRFDWDWHWRALREALLRAASCLIPDGSLVTLFAPGDDRLLESVCLAAASAGYRLDGWGYAPEVGYRLVWSWTEARSMRSASVDDLRRELVDQAKSAILSTLRARSEPTVESLLHAGACASLAQSGLLRLAAAIENSQPAAALTAEVISSSFDAALVSSLGEDPDNDDTVWWLTDEARPVERSSTLADRVEAVVQSLLRERSPWNQDELIETVYAHFPGALTPDLTLVQTSIESYGIGAQAGVHLRPEDDLQRRSREIARMCDGLVRLGEELGYDPMITAAREVRWHDDGGQRYVFVISDSAAVAHHLLGASVITGAVQFCLVVPDGRAGLIDCKLQRDPRLAAVVSAGEWQFIKFRHLRGLLEKDDLDRYALNAVLGLDPIIDQERGQIPLL